MKEMMAKGGNTDENIPWEYAKPSKRMGNLTSQLPTMFWILKSMNLALNPSFWMIRAYLREASLESSSDLAPVTTILPDAKINAVVFGSRIRMITAAKRYTISTSPGEKSRDVPWGYTLHFGRARRWFSS